MNQPLLLQADAEFCRNLFAQSLHAQMVFDWASGTPLAANPALVELLQPSTDDEFSLHAMQAIFSDLLLAPAQAPASQIVPWMGHTLEGQIRRLPGLLAGRTTGLLCVTDITVQTELQRLLNEESCALRYADENAQAEREKRERFIADMSHELRTPLNAILGFSGLLEHDAALPEEHRRKLKAIHHAGEHLLSTINNALHIGRPARAPSAAGDAGLAILDPAQFHLLVVDDQPDNRWLAENVFKEAGFQVSTAENGLEAIALFKTTPPDLIWMDIRMPVMDGYEATRRIRTLPGGDRVKVVAMTATTSSAEHQAILAAGCDGIVGKPLDQAEISATLVRLLGKATPVAADTPAEASPALPPFPALPEAVIATLVRAAELLDLAACRKLAETLAATHPEAAARLSAELEGFRFDRILDWCKETPG